MNTYSSCYLSFFFTFYSRYSELMKAIMKWHGCYQSFIYPQLEEGCQVRSMMIANHLSYF